jgi:hypothetical protein
MNTHQERHIAQAMELDTAGFARYIAALLERGQHELAQELVDGTFGRTDLAAADFVAMYAEG